MTESKTRLNHTAPGMEPYECPSGDIEVQGYEITVDKRTHELAIPKDRETEETVTVIIKPRGVGGGDEGA